MMAWRTRVFALVALLGLGDGKVKAVKYSSGFYFDNGESDRKRLRNLATFV